MITHSISLIGRRNANEDQHDIIININNSHKQHTLLKPMNFVSIYDGHGGKFVSKFLEENLIKNLKKCKNVSKIFTKINKVLSDYHFNSSNQTGSTALVTKYIKNENIIQIINLGDCRAVLCAALPIRLPTQWLSGRC